MILSFNEIEALAMKAARGAGVSWGLAEEAAFAARWLAERGLDWAGALRTRCEAAVGDAVTVDASGMHGAALCPLQAGAYLADGALPASSFTMTDVIAPVLLLPFVARAEAAQATVPLHIRFGTDRDFWIAHGQLYRMGPSRDLPVRGTVTIAPEALAAHVTALPLLPRPLPQTPDMAQALAGFERRTYVPASAQSRLAGAGAGLSDND